MKTNLKNFNLIIGLNTSATDLTKQYYLNGRFYENALLKQGKLKLEYSSSTHNLSTLSPNSSNNNMNELDDEANLLRRSNTRLSRRSSFKFNNQNTSNNILPKAETTNLFNFLNSGLEQSRELPTLKNMAASINDINNPSVNLTITSKDTNMKHQTDSLVNIKRYSSTGCLNTINYSSKQLSNTSEQKNNPIRGIPEEASDNSTNIIKPITSDKNTNLEEKSVNKNSVNSGVTTLDSLASSKNDANDGIVFPITLRRSLSTTQADQAHNQKRRENFPATLLEEKELNNEIQKENSLSTNALNLSMNTQLKSSNRLSGLKKLGSLYKTFEEDNVSPLSKRQSMPAFMEHESSHNQNYANISIVNQVKNIGECNNENLNQDLLNDRIKSYIVSDDEVSRKVKLGKDAATVSNQTINNESKKKSDDETTLFTTSGYKIFNTENSNKESCQQKNYLDTKINNNIIIQANRANSIRFDNNLKNDQTTSIKKTTPVDLNHILEPNNKYDEPVISRNESLDNKVKSLSKNWEIVTIKTQNLQQKNHNCSPLTTNSVTKLNTNKFNSNSEDENEIQANLSTQNDEVSTQVNNIFSTPHNSIIQAQLNKLNQPPLQINFHTIKSTLSNNSSNPSISTLQQIKKDQDYRKDNGHEYRLNSPKQSVHDLSRHSFHGSQDYVINPFNYESEMTNKNKSAQNIYQFKKPSTQHQNQTTKATSNIPTKSNTSIFNNSNSPPNTPSNNDDINDSNKRKSVSALYLSDTASTKAKKSEIKHKDTKNLLTLNNPSLISPQIITNSYSTSNNFFSSSNITPTINNINQLMINRRPSLNNGAKKTILNINMTKETPTQSQSQLTKNDSNISLSINCSSQNQNQSQLNDAQNTNFRLNENIGGEINNKKTSVFDRLSRTIKKQHDIH